MRVSPFTGCISVGLEPRRVFQHPARFALLFAVDMKVQQLDSGVKLARKKLFITPSLRLNTRQIGILAEFLFGFLLNLEW